MPAKWVHRFERKPGRWVFEPSVEARAEGNEIKKLVGSRWKAPSYYFHLRQGGHIGALRRHRRGAWFVKVDIADFFGSVSRSRIARVLKEFFEHAEARRMATASTVQHPTENTKRILPYGFIQSPLLASLALHKSSLGKILDDFHRSGRLVVTVYVDDIIVSGPHEAELQDALQALKSAAERSRFLLSEEKQQGPAESISVFNIELSAGNPLLVIPPKLSEFRDTFQASSSSLQRAGIQGYVHSVNPLQVEALL